MATETCETTADVSEFTGRVILGDCLDVMRGLPDGCVDAVVTDPPYGTGGYTRETEGLGKSPEHALSAVWHIEDWDEWRTDWLEEALRIAPTVVTFLPQTRIAEVWPMRAPVRLLMWCKPDPRPAFSIMHAFEPIVALGPLQGVFAKDYLEHSSIKPRRDTEAAGHPHQKPLDVMRWLVKLACPRGGTVLDCFSGTGTTAVACIAEDRQFIAIEREPEYVAIAEKRIAQARRAYQPALGL